MDELDQATSLVRRWVAPTPQYAWPLLARALGAPVWVKHENHTPTGAFKVRGGLVYTDRLRRQRPEVTGIVSATRGNHGQSLAFAGTAVGLKVTIVVPHGNSPDKNQSMGGFGAEVPETICAGAARILEVSDDDTAEAMRILFATTHNAPEPAGAMALAGLLSEAPAMRGRRVAIIQTGGNVDSDVFAQVLAGHTPTVS